MRRRLLAGTYTSRESEGIYGAAFDDARGLRGRFEPVARTANPSFVAVHPSGRFVYAVNELWEFEGRPGGGVTAFAVEPSTAGLAALNAELSHGTDPCHLAFDESGRFLFVSNFGTGSLAVLPLRADGSLEQASDVVEHRGRGLHPRRQSGPHVHSTLPVPGTPFVLAADLGIDAIAVYEFDAARGVLRVHGSVAAEPGAGPRHMAFVPGTAILAVSNEIDSTVATYAWDGAAGELTPLFRAPTAPAEDSYANSAADLHVHGDRVYISNRGDDSIVAFRVDGSGRLMWEGRTPTGGAKPRAFTIAPGGRWLLAANQDSDTVTIFAIGPGGTLAAHGDPVRVPSPTSLAWLDVGDQ